MQEGYDPYAALNDNVTPAADQKDATLEVTSQRGTASDACMGNDARSKSLIYVRFKIQKSWDAGGLVT